MRIKFGKVVYNSESFHNDSVVEIKSNYSENIELPNSIAYPPLINSHDHLIGNWYPLAKANNPYDTVDKWVDEMQFTPSFLERNKIWKGNGKFELLDERAELITLLGAYKNLFSGVHIVQDHISYQKPEYYTKFPIQVIEKYKQCHSMSMGNWWGGKSASEEYLDTEGKMPFIIHLAEGTNPEAYKSFDKFKAAGLLKPNTMLIHGIALTKENIKECAEAGTSICWCPKSNMFLIGKTLDLETCLEYGVNITIGTDSTMSGSINLLEEIKFGASLFPDIPANIIFKMATENAQKALMLPKKDTQIGNENILIMPQKVEDPYQNLLHCDLHDIKFMMSKGIPILGEIKLLDYFAINRSDYSFFSDNGVDKFVLGHPDRLIQQVSDILGYEKHFPYIPF